MKSPHRALAALALGILIVSCSTLSAAQRPALRVRPTLAATPSPSTHQIQIPTPRIKVMPKLLPLAAKRARLAKLDIKEFSSTITLCPSHPTERGSSLKFGNPVYVIAEPQGHGVASFVSQENIYLPLANHSPVLNFRPWVTGRYVVEFLVSDATTVKLFRGGEETVYTSSPTNILVVVDGIAGTMVNFGLLGTTGNPSTLWNFHAATISLVK